jgi:hypothetical protein
MIFIETHEVVVVFHGIYEYHLKILSMPEFCYGLYRKLINKKRL